MEKGTIGDTLTIENQFTKLSARELRSLSIEQLAAYRKCERANSLFPPPQRGNLALRKILHPLLMGVLYIYHIAKGIRIKTNGSVPKTDRPIIFSVSHIGLYDVEVILQTIKKHVYILSGDEEAMYRTFDGWYFDTNGVIYVDPEDPADRRTELNTAVKYLRLGQSLMWFPEGTWNLSPNYVILPIRYGIIEAAVQANAVIIPVGLEQYDKKHGIDFIVNIGTPFDPALYFSGELTKEKKIELAETLRGNMARLKMDAWEAMERADIDNGYWDAFIAKRLAEWPFYTMDIIRKRTFNPNGYVSEAEVFSHLSNISIGPHNAFLARIQQHTGEQLQK